MPGFRSGIAELRAVIDQLSQAANQSDHAAAEYKARISNDIPDYEPARLSSIGCDGPRQTPRRAPRIPRGAVTDHDQLRVAVAQSAGASIQVVNSGGPWPR